MDASPVMIALGFIALMLLLIFLGVPAFAVFLIIPFLGIWVLRDLTAALHVFANIPFKTSFDYTWSMIPLFIFMGEVVYYSGLGADLFNAIYKWLGRFHGGIASATVATSAAFGAICGDGYAAGVTMTAVCLPELRKYKYDDGLSLASIASGAILSLIIPPSTTLIIFGILTNTSITALFMAGVIPGIIITIGYVCVIYITCRRDPTKGPPGPKATWAERISSLKPLWGVGLIIGIVFGGIYSGFITPTEAGGLGATAALITALLKRKLNWEILRKSFKDTVISTGMIFVLFLGAWIFAPFLSYSTLPMTIVEFMGNWPPLVIVFVVLIIFFIIGIIFEAFIFMVITIPMFLPVLSHAGIDMVWFGIILMVVLVLGGNTPPYASNIFIISGLVKEVPVSRIFRAIIPFVLSVLVVVVIVALVPALATWLPTMTGG